ncbi:hypothetical protein FB451DRAFT_1466175 [Mycena latifolia]|nr:hypothetical protein FB451DRAFT_1466175 [Mycena latifolia]
MDSTPRGSKPISQWLPNEIITQIIQALPRRADQGVLCRTSKLLHGLGAPVLYYAVDLRTYTSIDAFCSTVLSNPALAEFRRQLVDATKTLVNLEAVSIPIALLPNINLRELFRWTFPRLSQCSLGSRDARWSSTQREDTLGSFLGRHPGLQNLHVQYGGTLDPWPAAFTRIPLRRLEHLKCPVKLVPSITTSVLKEAWISWYWDEDEEPDDLRAIGLALNSMTRTEVPFISSNDIFEHDNNVMEIVHTLSMYIPHTKTFHLQLFDLHSVSVCF